MGSVVWVTTRRGPEPSGRNLKSHGECFFFPWKKGTRQMLSLESVHARAGVSSEQPMQHIFICTARFVFIRAGSGSAHVSPGSAILATSGRPGRREGELHQDTGAAHDQRRDSVTIAFGRTREKERKSKPSELRRVEWRERGSRCLWCVGAAQDES